MKRLLALSVLLLGLALLPGCRKADTSEAGKGQAARATPGIDQPLDVEGIKVKVKAARRTDSYDAGGGQRLRPQQKEDELAVVTATASGSGVQETLNRWGVSVALKDEKGRATRAQVTITNTPKDRQDPDEVTWVFAVSRSSRSLTLNLPGDKAIVLDPLLEKR